MACGPLYRDSALLHFVKQGAGGPWGRQATNCRLGYVPAILERRDISPGPVEPGGRGQILADQLTLFRQGRGQIMLTILQLAPSPTQNFRRSAGPEDVTYVPRDAPRVP